MCLWLYFTIKFSFFFICSLFAIVWSWFWAIYISIFIFILRFIFFYVYLLHLLYSPMYPGGIRYNIVLSQLTWFWSGPGGFGVVLEWARWFWMFLFYFVWFCFLEETALKSSITQMQLLLPWQLLLLLLQQLPLALLHRYVCVLIPNDRHEISSPQVLYVRDDDFSMHGRTEKSSSGPDKTHGGRGGGGGWLPK